MAGSVREIRGALLLALAFILPATTLHARTLEGPAPPARVTGIVTREDGSPVRGALVFGRFGWKGSGETPAASRCRTSTDGKGRFILEGPPGWLAARWPMVTALADGLAARSVLLKHGPPDMRLVLLPETRLRIRVANAAGDPVPGVRLHIAYVNMPLRPLREGAIPQGEAVYLEAEDPERVAPRTDARGEVEVRNLPRGGWVDFRVHDPSWVETASQSNAFRRISLAQGPVSDTQTVVVGPAATLEGRLVTEKGQPVAGRRIELDPAMPGEAWTDPAVSDTLGRFRIQGLSGGPYYVTLRGEDGPDYVLPGLLQVTMKAGEHRRGYDVVCPRGSVIRGRILDAATGKPLPGARALFGHEDLGDGSCRTDSRGRFQHRVRPGEWWVELGPPDGYDDYGGVGPVGRNLSRIRTVNRKDYDLGDLRIVLRPFRTFYGRVLKPDGTPAAGADVYFFGEDWEPHPAMSMGHLAADTRGLFTMSHSRYSGITLFRARSGDLSTPGDTRVDLGTPPVLLTLKLQQRPRATLRGQVMDIHGKPVEGAEVDIAFPVMSKAHPMARSGAEGRFRLEVWPDEECAAYVISQEFGLGESERVRPRPGETLDLPPIVLWGADGYLEVQVLDRSGKPVPGIALEIPALAQGPHPLKANRRTDARGRVRIAGVARGSYKVRVIPGGGSPPVEETVAVPGYQIIHLP